MSSAARPTPTIAGRTARHPAEAALGRGASSWRLPGRGRGRLLAARVLALCALTVAACSPRSQSLEEFEAAGGFERYADVEALGGMPDAFLEIEKHELKLGFIKLADSAPLVVAKEKGFFSDEGLNVRLEAQANWKVLLDRVISGELDGAHMLAGQPIAATIGYGTAAHVITAYSLNYNGNAITLSDRLWRQMIERDARLEETPPPRPVGARSLRPVVDTRRAAGRDLQLGMVFPVSAHNYQLQYWLAAGGIHPGFYTAGDSRGVDQAEVILSVTPPPQMPATMEAGTIDGYCVGEPWNQQAMLRGIGVPILTSHEIWQNAPEKVFGVTAQWDTRYPNTHVALVKALLRAGQWLDQTDAAGTLINRPEAVRLISRPEYVGADLTVFHNSMMGTYAYGPEEVEPQADFMVFFRNHASFPHYSDCVWFLTQMRRWGQIAEPRPAGWYAETAKEIYRPDIYRRAAELLAAQGRLRDGEIPAPEYDGYRPATGDFIDGRRYDGRDPIGYVNSFEIGFKD